MDLLGQYGSDDDSSSSASDRSKSPPPSILKKTTLPPGIPSPPKPAATKVGNNRAGTGAGTATATTAVSRRGKKLVSLHSVLPPHILGQLTKSEFEDDSSDEEANNHTRNQGKSGSSAENNSDSNNKKKTASQDEGIASFLSALGAAKTNKIVNKTSTANKGTESSKLGAAFTSFTSTTTTRKRKDGAITITTTNSASGKPFITIPNGPSSVSSNEERRTPTAQGEPVAGGGSPSGYTPLSLSPRTAFHPFRNSAAVSAAPSVPNVAAAAAHAPRFSAPPVVFQQQHHPPRQIPHQQQQHQFQSQPSPMPAPEAHYNPRSKKRQLQKALRAGQLDQALDSATSQGVSQVEQLDQARPTEYVPQSETYAVPAHGVRVAATEMYNPKAGTTTTADAAAISKKGKNQINALMASAATFELQQARGGPAGKSNSQRTGAKKKYGW